MVLILPTPDVDYDNALTLMRRLWIAKYDPEEENVKLADRCVNDFNFILV